MHKSALSVFAAVLAPKHSEAVFSQIMTSFNICTSPKPIHPPTSTAKNKTNHLNARPTKARQGGRQWQGQGMQLTQSLKLVKQPVEAGRCHCVAHQGMPAHATHESHDASLRSKEISRRSKDASPGRDQRMPAAPCCRGSKDASHAAWYGGRPSAWERLGASESREGAACQPRRLV
jgi:hypothetical protein